MVFFDWNHDGKKNYVDNAIEMMIIDDIEEEKAREQANRGNTSEWGAAYSGKQAYSKHNQADKAEVDAFFNALRTPAIILGFVLFSLVFVVNVMGIFGGYCSVLGLIVSAAVLILIARSVRKHGIVKRD